VVVAATPKKELFLMLEGPSKSGIASLDFNETRRLLTSASNGSAQKATALA
jgi:hypothetical protein